MLKCLDAKNNCSPLCYSHDTHYWSQLNQDTGLHEPLIWASLLFTFTWQIRSEENPVNTYSENSTLDIPKHSVAKSVVKSYLNKQVPAQICTNQIL